MSTHVNATFCLKLPHSFLSNRIPNRGCWARWSTSCSRGFSWCSWDACRCWGQLGFFFWIRWSAHIRTNHFVDTLIGIGGFWLQQDPPFCRCCDLHVWHDLGLKWSDHIWSIYCKHMGPDFSDFGGTFPILHSRPLGVLHAGCWTRRSVSCSRGFCCWGTGSSRDQRRFFLDQGQHGPTIL